MTKINRQPIKEEQGNQEMIERLKERLKEFDEEFAEAEIKESFSPIPDGKYRALTRSAGFVESQFDGSAQLKIEYELLLGRYAGRKVRRYYDLENALALPALKRDLHLFGLKIKKLSELPLRLDELLDKGVEIKLRTKEANNGKKYQNCYLVEVRTMAIEFTEGVEQKW